MRLIGTDYKKIPYDNEITRHYYWEFDVKKRDFFLRKKIEWTELCTDAFHITVDNYKVIVPSGFFILIGDFDGGLDFIRADEIIGRPFEAFTFRSDFEKDSWRLRDIRTGLYEEDRSFFIPKSKNPFPIMVGESEAMIVSKTDLYNKISSFSFSDII